MQVYQPKKKKPVYPKRPFFHTGAEPPAPPSELSHRIGTFPLVRLKVQGQPSFPFYKVLHTGREPAELSHWLQCLPLVRPKVQGRPQTFFFHTGAEPVVSTDRVDLLHLQAIPQRFASAYPSRSISRAKMYGGTVFRDAPPAPTDPRVLIRLTDIWTIDEVEG